MKYIIPDMRVFLKESKPWGVKKVFFDDKWHHNYEGYEHQRTNPDIRSLILLLGMKKNQTILFLAGHKGTWALALAKAGLIVTYSELSAELKDFVKKNVKHKNIVQYLVLNYVLEPKKEEEYDWSFTFEAVGPKEFFFLRSMLNSKGGKYVVWNKSSHSITKISKIQKTFRLLKKVYGIKTTIKTVNILSKDRENIEDIRKHTVLTLITNAKARKKVSLDLNIFEILKNNTSLNKIVKKTGESRKNIKQSLKRISKWSVLFDKNYVKEVIIRE